MGVGQKTHACTVPSPRETRGEFPLSIGQQTEGDVTKALLLPAMLELPNMLCINRDCIRGQILQPLNPAQL